jgi:CMP/dCMP kinase
MSFVISIDGPAASGKSSAAKALAKEFGAIFVNSGALYRAVTWAALEQGVVVADPAAVAAWVADLEVVCGQENGFSNIRIGGVDPEPYIRDQRINAAVSLVAAVPEVRSIVVAKLRSYQQMGAVIMEGRDIGSVVFPDTPYKFYVDASEEVRNSRRQAQGEQDSIAARDKADSSRKAAPLKVPEGAVVIDSTHLDLAGVVSAIKAQLANQGFSA